jgi:hypothetical protein
MSQRTRRERNWARFQHRPKNTSQLQVPAHLLKPRPLELDRNGVRLLLSHVFSVEVRTFAYSAPHRLVILTRFYLDRRKKCTNEKPKCLQCVRRGSACVYPARRTNNAKRGKKSMQEEDEEDEEELEPDVYSDEDMEGGHEQSYSPPSSPEPTPPPPSIRFASSSRDPFHPSNKFYKGMQPPNGSPPALRTRLISSRFYSEDNPYAAGFETSPLYRDYTYPGKPSYYSNNYHYDDNIYPSRIHFYNSNSPDPHHHYHTELPHILCPVCRRLTCGCGGAYYIPDGTDPIYADSYLNTQTPISDLRSEPSPSMGVPRKDFESG